MSDIISVTHINSGQITYQLMVKDTPGEPLAWTVFKDLVAQLSSDYSIEWVFSDGITVSKSVGIGTKQADIFCGACCQRLVWDSVSKSWVEDPTVVTMPNAVAHTHVAVPRTFGQS